MGGFCHKEVEVHRGADRICIEASRIGNTSQGSDPEDGHYRADLLPVEEEVWWTWYIRAPQIAQLEEENRTLKQMVADYFLDKHMRSRNNIFRGWRESRKTNPLA